MYFEDIVIGERVELGSFTFTVNAIKDFARLYDPQPFHLDEDAALHGPYGGLIASGWQVAAIWMRLMIAWRDARLAVSASGSSALGPSPGFRDMVWAKPVRPDDTLAYYAEVIAKKESEKRPSWGLVTQDNGAFNQTGEQVFRFTGSVFWQRRSR